MRIVMKNIKSNTVITMTRAGIIAALYTALTLAVYPISFGAVQFRISEALCILPVLFPEAVPALFIGCIISNLLSPNIVVLDVIFGSLATLSAAALTRKLRDKPLLAPLPPVLINAVVVGAVIAYSVSGFGGGFRAAFLYNALTVGAGEIAVCYFLGLPLLFLLKKSKSRFINDIK